MSSLSACSDTARTDHPEIADQGGEGSATEATPNEEKRSCMSTAQPDEMNAVTSAMGAISLDAGRTRIAVDLGYEWPKEARPAKERQGAVVRQLANFIQIVDKHDRGDDFPAVKVLGAGVVAVRDKLASLGPRVESDTADVFDGYSDLVYLSPDADEFLDTTRGWPFGERPVTIVVGGLVDRKQKRGRSLRRAGEHAGRSVRCVQLPLTSDNLGAPLNIDTVLTMLYYWWAFETLAPANAPANAPEASAAASGAGTTAGAGAAAVSPAVSPAVSQAFARARYCALHEHTQRHPNQGKHIL